jgi:hypothetical protein
MSRLLRPLQLGKVSVATAELPVGLVHIFPAHLLTETITAVDSYIFWQHLNQLVRNLRVPRNFSCCSVFI